jgi:hypothetical protein
MNANSGKLNFFSALCSFANARIISAIFDRLFFTTSLGNQVFKVGIGNE